LLADARQVERLNQDERIAGFLLALCTLFLGALLQAMLTSSGAMQVSLIAAAFMGGLALFFYWRAHKMWQEIHVERHLPLWPPQDEGSG